MHVYDFFSKESGSLEPVNTSPVLLGRYKRSRTLALGIAFFLLLAPSFLSISSNNFEHFVKSYFNLMVLCCLLSIKEMLWFKFFYRLSNY